MNTPAHAVLELFVLERGRWRDLGPWIVAGAVVPDVPNLAFFAYEHFVQGLDAAAIYPAVYDEPRWQLVLAPWHSVFLPLLLLGVAGWRRHAGLAALAGGLLLHLVADLLTHGVDAHPHLWPVSDVRWHSPVSYWDRAHHAGVYVPIEAVATVLAGVAVWRRDRAAWRRILVIGCSAWLVVAWAAGWAFWGS